MWFKYCSEPGKKYTFKVIAEMFNFKLNKINTVMFRRRIEIDLTVNNENIYIIIGSKDGSIGCNIINVTNRHVYI